MALYPLFRVGMHSLIKSMHTTRMSRKKYEKQPENIEKISYHYSLDDIHEFNIYRCNDIETKDLPLVIDIHGGCWFYGDKDSYDLFSYDLVSKGVNVTSLTYRTADKVTLKEQIQDIFQYLQFLEKNYERLGISLDQVMLTGDSAGAQLSLLSYVINEDPELQEIFEVEPVNIDFKCMALTHPVCFIDTAARIPENAFLSRHISIPGLKRLLYGLGWEFKPEYQRSVTPDKYVTRDIKLPPLLIVTSKGDNSFLYQSERLARFLSGMKIPYAYYYEDSEDAKHVFNVNEPHEEASQNCNNKILEFFAKCRDKAAGHREKYLQHCALPIA